MASEPFGVEPRCDVSVVIPSYNSRGTIRACLESVLGQETELTYEVLVADSSDDGTDEIIRADFPGVRLIHSRERLTGSGSGCAGGPRSAPAARTSASAASFRE